MSTKNQLLLYLKKNKGEWISGELISQKLDVSRASISKYVNNFRKNGYNIKASTKKGYMLCKNSDFLLPEEIQYNLKTKILGKEIIHFFETDSTNSRAKELANKGAEEGTLVIAEIQTQGRGSKGRFWFSVIGEGICISLILRPEMQPAEAPAITLMTAVAMTETLISLTPLNVNIKWPNDIFINGKKISGILTEITTEMDTIDYIVVGLGLNVNTPLKKFPEEIREIASSILIETRTIYPRSEIIKEFLFRFETYYTIIQNEGFHKVIKRWKELSNIIGKKIKVDVLGKKYFGIVKDINNEGVLLISDKNDHIINIYSGDVTIID